MNRYIAPILLTLLLVVACGKEDDSFVIKGKLNNLGGHPLYAIYEHPDGFAIDTLMPENGKFEMRGVAHNAYTPVQLYDYAWQPYMRLYVAEADAILDAYPNVKFDLTPGTHYNDMAADYEGWRDFFIRRADRILYGTDNCVLLNDNYNAHCRRILETNETMDHYGTMIKGFALPDAVLEKIYETNFMAFAGASPRKTDKAMLTEFVDWNKELIADSQDVDKLRAELDAVVQNI